MNEIVNIEIRDLADAPDNPFHVTMDAQMEKLIESIAENGIIAPIVTRKRDDGKYEIISGHRRKFACEILGIKTIPAVVRNLSRDEAVIALVDSNLHREHILPSEKAFAYKLKMEAMSRQGKRSDLTLSQVATKSDSAKEIGKASSESRDTVFRYIRLTYLIPELLQKVDEGRIAFTPAVELSYLTEPEQQDLLTEMEYADCTPSLSQAIRLHRLSQEGRLSSDGIYAVMSELKPNQKEKISLDYETVRQYFPGNYSPQDVQNAILKLVKQDFRRRQKQAERDSR